MHKARPLASLALGLLLCSLLGAPVAMGAPQTGAADESVKVIVNLRGRAGIDPVAAAEAVSATIRKEGGRTTRQFRLINAVAATLPRDALAQLRADPRVKSVEIDATIRAFHHPPDTGNSELEAAWGVEHVGAGAVHAAGNTGVGVRVGVIDTGIDYTHPDLDGVYAGGWDFFNNDADPMDDQGHGTHVAGSLAAELNSPPAGVVGVAPGASLYAYKVLGADGEGDYSHLISALERAALVDEVDVVNMSLGGKVASEALAAAIASASAAGVVLVAAAGNVDPTNFFELLYGCPVAYPARYPEVMSTTFTGQNNELTGFSCTGPEVDFASPGDLINSTVPTGTCPLCAPSGYRSDLSGTSMASPHLAGTVALVLSHGIANAGDPQTLADDVRTHLCSTAGVGFGVLTTPIPTSDPRYASYFGCGVTDAKNALLTNPPPTDGEPPPENEPPVATNDVATTAQGTAVMVDVLDNDTDAEEDELTVNAVTAPANGTTAIVSNSVRYTPGPGYVGADTFDYTVSDGNGGTDTATVSVTVTLPTGPIHHSGDLDNVSTRQTQRWTARVRIQVHNPAHKAISGVVITGVFSTGAVRSCTSNSKGRCVVARDRLSLNLASVTFTVTNMTKAGRTYTPSLNHDPEADSNGTVITVPRP